MPSRFRLVALVAACLSGGSAGAAELADVVYRNGAFYTVSDQRPWARAVAIKDGRFIKVGTEADMEAVTGPNTTTIDLQGSFVLPGLIDSHTHPSFEAERPYHFVPGFLGSLLRRHYRLTDWLRPSPKRRVEALADSVRIMSSYGITAIGEGKTEAARLPAWEELIARGMLSQHVLMYLHALDGGGPARMQHARQLADAFGRSRLPGVRLGAKIFIDGYLESRSAYLVEPYGVPGGGIGGLNAPVAEVRALVEELDRAGIPIQIHAIGDGGVREALNAYEAALRKRNGKAGPVHSIVHVKLAHDDDLPRFAKLGVSPTLYAFQAQPSPQNAFLEEAIGTRRREQSFLPMKKLWDAGAVVGSNSDWASSSMNPFYGMYVGVTRQCPHHPERGKLGARNALTLEQMIRTYTLNNAHLLNMEREAGSIEPGKWADMAILDRNILERGIDELLETSVVKTVFEGRVVYDRSRKLPDALARPEAELLDMGNHH